MKSDEKTPIVVRTDIEAKCADCPALELLTEQTSLKALGQVIDIQLSITCKNKEMCDALEKRRWDSFMPCDPGDDLFFLNGQTGSVTEVVFDTEDDPLIRCVKYIGHDSYDSSFRACMLGRTVFLDDESCEKAMQKEVPHEEHTI